MKKYIKYIYILILVVIITIVLFICFYFVVKRDLSSNGGTKINSAVQSDEDIYGGYQETVPENDVRYVRRNYENESSCPFKDNVSYTECLIKNLDRLSAIREWKQKKLENLKYPEIGTELTLFLVEDSLKIKKWRENFENARDLKCNASVIYWYGSGSPGSVASCSIEEEISALKILDIDYYVVIMNEFGGSKGIPDFEPNEQDIQKLMETNKTTRENCCGGIW